MSNRAASARVKHLAAEGGFGLAKITTADLLTTPGDRFVEWVRDGRHGDMAWIDEERAARSADSARVLPGARSVICVGLPYWAGHRDATGVLTGTIARYAWGRDYHTVIGERLQELALKLHAEFGGDYRCYVDTGPVMDKALAHRAGLGWYGRNSNILTDEFGSFVLLGEIVTTLVLAPDREIEKSCGSCRLCVVACPTGAIGPDYSVDARRCISYLTIEHRGPIPRPLRPHMGSWVFGCDICQDVCPPTMLRVLKNSERREWASSVRHVVQGEALLPGPITGGGDEHHVRSPNPLFSNGIRKAFDLIWLLRLSHEEYIETFRGTAIKRAKVWMLRRNAAVALGNVGDASVAAPLAEALQSDTEYLVRGHAAWALGRLAERHGERDCTDTLLWARRTERSATVREEIEFALTMARAPGSILETSSVKGTEHGQSRQRGHDQSTDKRGL